MVFYDILTNFFLRISSAILVDDVNNEPTLCKGNAIKQEWEPYQPVGSNHSAQILQLTPSLPIQTLL